MRTFFFVPQPGWCRISRRGENLRGFREENRCLAIIHFNYGVRRIIIKRTLPWYSLHFVDSSAHLSSMCCFRFESCLPVRISDIGGRTFLCGAWNAEYFVSSDVQGWGARRSRVYTFFMWQFYLCIYFSSTSLNHTFQSYLLWILLSFRIHCTRKRWNWVFGPI